MSKIPREKLDLAESILLAVERRLRSEVAHWHYVQVYSNGREQGYHIGGGDKVVSFSEFRSSDGIVVYVGDRGTFSMQGNVPSEEAYENKKFFPWNGEKEAAEFIVPILEENYKKWQERIENDKEKEAQKA